MTKGSLQKSIFRLVIVLVLTTSVTILINVWLSTYQQAQQRMSKDINLAQTVLAKSLENREELLFNSASVLSDDFGFKQSIATKDVPTIVSALNNHADRIDADLMSVFNLNGTAIASTSFDSTAQMFLSENQVNQVIGENGLSAFMLINNKLYKVILVSINAPTPIALSLVGFEIDQHFIADFENTVQLSILITATQQDKAVNIAGSPAPITEQTTTQNSYKSLQWHHLLYANQAIISQSFSVYNDEALNVDLRLSQTVDKLISEFAALKTRISIIILLSSTIAFLVASIYARKLVKPLAQLSTIAKNISLGNYEQAIIDNHSSKELSNLSHAFKNMQRSIRERENEITYQAEHDPLTGLYTRYHAGYLIDEKLANQESFQVVAINVVGFRDINDVFGYQDGDLCLSALASRIASLGGIAAKFTGGEFLWLPDSSMDINQLGVIQHKLEYPVIENEVTIPIKLALASIACPQQASNAESVFKRLNIVIDESQLVNSRRLLFDDKFEHKYARRLKIITQLKKALQCNSSDLSLNYQPKLSVKTQRVNAVEALIRWTDAGLGFVPPDEFIGIAEQAGLIGDVTEWVIKRAIDDALTMRNQGLHCCIAINLSARDLTTGKLLPLVKQSLLRAGLPESVLSFEITESDLVQDAELAISLLNEYKQEGYQLAIDDFGTGYSSLAYLKSFPVDTIKIDKSFVLELSHNKDDQDIVTTILELANKFNLEVVAEGVEDKESLHLLSEMGCHMIQGYYICKPVSLNMLIPWCAQHEKTNWLEA
ncbi:MAG: EAL domain-containing protein [Glaciecola sp.]